jgi:hypothetical protein
MGTEANAGKAEPRPNPNPNVGRKLWELGRTLEKPNLALTLTLI